MNFKYREKDRDNSIMFIGQVGAGKTHLSLAIDNGLMEVDKSIGSRLMDMCGSCLVEMKGKRLNYRIYG